MEQIQTHKSERPTGLERIIANMIEKSNFQKLKARILVVDDDPETGEVLRDLLVFAGFDVIVAENGTQAVDLLSTVRHFDLMISDMQMPKMDGLELLRLSRRLRKHLPVVILTGHGTVHNGIHALEQGAHDYILKPFNTEKLLGVVEAALKSRSVQLCTA